KITSNDLKVTGNTFLNNDKVDATSADFNLQNDFTTKGTVSTDKLIVKSNNVVNDGKILSGSANISVKEKVINNDTVNIGKFDVNAKSLENKKDIRANNLNITTNENTVNTGTITANNVSVNAGSVVNTNKIETESLNIKTTGNTENSGQILSNNLTVNSDNFINKNEVSVDKGTITANNVIKNENKINANELTTNSRSLVNEKKIEVGTGTFTTTEDIENKDLLAGNNLKFKGRNLLNSEGKTIFATNKLEADMAGNVVNKKAEILSQNEIELKADIIDNTVGKIKGTGDVKLTGRKIENVGEVGDLTKYKLYWETWNGKRFDSHADVATPERGWTIEARETLSGSTEDKESTFEYFLSNFGGADGVSYIFKELDKVVRQKKYTQQGTIAVNSTEYPVVPLMNKIESEAKTNHAVISGKNITINAGEELNNTDGIISASEINKIDAPKIVHKVTIDENNPIALTDGVEKLTWWKTSHHGKSRYPVNYERYLVPSSRVGYVAGQPSIIEGKEVLIDKTKIVSERFDSAKGQIIKNAGTQNNVSGKNIEIVKNVSGIQDIKNTGIISVNIGSISGINGVNVNTGINGRNGINIGSLYVPSTDPSSRYVIENRTEFITRGNYYGGDYFLNRMGYVEDWDRVKLLGDAYYDNMLIEQTLTEKLGTRYINGLSGEELTKQLIDNATTAKKDLQLRQGVALTKDQINNLKNDIIWYEYETVNGKKTLVPKIYLSKATIEKLEVDGRSKIYGTEKTIIKASGDFENTGIKIGSKTGITEVTGNRIKNETVTNERAEIVGKKVKVEALTGNIENIGGKIVAVERTELIAKNGDIINDGKKIKEGYYLDSKNHTEYETVSNIGEISAESVRLETNNYNSTGGALVTKNLELQLTGNINENALELNGSDRFGDDKNYQKYKAKEYVGSGIVAEKATGKVGDINLKGSAFVVEDGKGLKVGNVKAESAVNEYDSELKGSIKGPVSRSSSFTQSHIEENAASNFKIGENADIKGTVTGIGSNIYIGDNSFVGGKVTTDSRELHNTYYNEEKKSGFSASAKGTSVSAGYGKSKNTYDEKSTINAKSSLHVGNNTVLNNGASITATDFEHGKIEINNGDVTYGARKDTRDVSTSSKSSYIGVTANVKSPALDRVKQAKEAVDQIKKGDTVGGAVNAVNFVTGTVHGLAGNQGNRQRNYDKNGSVGKQGVKDASANNNFYANIGLDVGFNTSKSETNSHEESGVVTTIKGIDEESSITYNNVKNINYIGTQAKDTKFIYNEVENINKEAVKLNNSYSSNSKGFGVSAGATVGYGHKLQTTGNGGSVSVTRSNMNTEETLYQNGRFTNVEEVHNGTKNMRLSGFNQEGGKVAGSIENFVEESKQNTSRTTGSSSGVTLGIGSNGVPSSASISGSRTSGSRAYVDNQTTFILGEGSNLTIGKVENTAGIIGVEGNGKLKINEYKGKDLYNHDNLTTTGGSIGVDFGKGGAKVNGIGVNNENHRKEGITRHTVIGNVETGNATGSPINRDRSKANETTRDDHSSTNVYIEGQTIDYATNPSKLKEDIGKAKDEIKDIGRAIKESLNDRGDDNRNFLGQLSEGRLQRTIENIGEERLRKSTTQEDISKTLKDTYKDLGYDVNIVFTTPDKAPQLRDEHGNIKAGTAYVGAD
ncbi:hemagglutinin repeat-containing protein, partial [Pseudoleptotrichia goodfellowii]